MSKKEILFYSIGSALSLGALATSATTYFLAPYGQKIMEARRDAIMPKFERSRINQDLREDQDALAECRSPYWKLHDTCDVMRSDAARMLENITAEQIRDPDARTILLKEVQKLNEDAYRCDRRINAKVARICAPLEKRLETSTFAYRERLQEVKAEEDTLSIKSRKYSDLQDASIMGMLAAGFFSICAVSNLWILLHPKEEEDEDKEDEERFCTSHKKPGNRCQSQIAY